MWYLGDVSQSKSILPRHLIRGFSAVVLSLNYHIASATRHRAFVICFALHPLLHLLLIFWAWTLCRFCQTIAFDSKRMTYLWLSWHLTLYEEEKPRSRYFQPPLGPHLFPLASSQIAPAVSLPRNLLLDLISGMCMSHDTAPNPCILTHGEISSYFLTVNPH